MRWSLWAPDILDAADKKAAGCPYRLARGDKELVVLPEKLIPQLNRLGNDVLDSKQSHAFAFLAHPTGLQRTIKATYQTQILQRRVTPAVAQSFVPLADRILATIQKQFPSGDDWTNIKPLDPTTACFSEGMCLVLFGAEMAKSPRLLLLTSKLAEDVGAVAFTMRLVSSVLQRLLVWLLPAEWDLDAKWTELETFVAPEVRRLQELGEANTGADLLAWMASINSVANLMCNTLADLAAHPDVLDQVRAEIRARHAQIGGGWDMAALGGLDKLESAMKETARLSSSPLIVYSRVLQKDMVLGGVALKKGQFVTMSGRARTMDPVVFEGPGEYNGLRFCAEDKLEEHQARAFASVDTNILTWGAGRLACPGRQIADLIAKVFLTSLTGAYEFSLVDGKSLKRAIFHGFVFFNPEGSLLMRRRKNAVHIKFHPPKGSNKGQVG